MSKKEKSVKGFEDLLEFEKSSRSSFLFQGPQGTGKTMLSLYILHKRYKDFGEKGLYLGANESLSLIYDYLRNNESLKEPHKERGISYIDLRENLNWKEKIDEINLNELINKINALIEEKKPKIVVIDSIFSLYLLSNSQLNQEIFYYKLINGLKREELILFFVCGEEFGKSYHTPFDAVIKFNSSRKTKKSVVSKIWLKKMRGQGFEGTKHDLRITDNEIGVYAEEKKEKTKKEPEPRSPVKHSIKDKIKKIEKIEKDLKNMAEFGVTEEVMISFRDEKEFNEFQESELCHKGNIEFNETKNKGGKIWLKVKVSSPSGEKI